MYAVKPSCRSLVDFNLRPAVTINDWVNCYYGFYQNIFSYSYKAARAVLVELSQRNGFASIIKLVI